MCLNPRKRKNPKYLPNKSNNFTPQLCPDPRLKYITFPCGKCFECRKRYGSDWRFRLHQEFLTSPSSRFHFVTLTFSDDWIYKLRNGYRTDRGVWINGIGFDASDNDLATIAVRRFLERYRRLYGKSLRHFFVTELGGLNGRIHLHGIIIDCKAGRWSPNGKFYVDRSIFDSIWKYGFTFLGWCNSRTINYVTKYITKFDEYHPSFVPKVLTSPAFGKGYVTDVTIRYHQQFNNGNGVWHVTTSNGYQIAIPRYLKLKLFTESQLQKRFFELIENPPPRMINGREVSERCYQLTLPSRFAESCNLMLSSRPVFVNHRTFPIFEDKSFNF